MAVAGLIVGLGNPGKQYESTRHNMGFLFVDELLREAKNVSSMSGDKFRCELWKAALPGSPDQWLIAKPQTFMNLSGECVQPLAAWHRLLPENILVVHDELDIAPGRMKFKKGGGNAGHNGLKSITQRLGTPDFYRLRLGIGRSPHGGEDTVNCSRAAPVPRRRTPSANSFPPRWRLSVFLLKGTFRRHARGERVRD
ncbi:MAG: aminoacyl-tRNA hydrolase [Bilophila wadsworthia]